MFQTFRENFGAIPYCATPSLSLSEVPLSLIPVLPVRRLFNCGYLMLLGLINIYDDYKIKQTGSRGLGFVTGLIFVVLAVAFLFLHR